MIKSYIANENKELCKKLKNKYNMPNEAQNKILPNRCLCPVLFDMYRKVPKTIHVLKTYKENK